MVTEGHRFEQLQDGLGALLDGARTTVVVPSLTLHPDELRKIPGAVHFEQRLLFELGRLRSPGARLVYVTSERIDPAVLDYALDVTAGRGVRDRLTLIDCADSSVEPLTDKILRRPDVLDRIAMAGGDYLITYTSTPSERDLAVRLGMPLFACDPRLRGLGDKSGGRELLRAVGVPVPDGYERLASADAVVGALAALKKEHPELDRAVVKLNDAFAGTGNAVFTYGGAPEGQLSDWIAAELPCQLAVPGDTWSSFLSKLEAMGGVVECFHSGPAMRSPSVQLEIRPGGDVRVLSTHDQILGGASGQTFVGCAFPARAAYRGRIQDLALRAGHELAARGVLGQLSVDFLADERDRDRTYALEVNLRMGGATAPFLFVEALLRGHYDRVSGDYLTPEGEPRHYVSSDRIQLDRLRGSTAKAVFDLAVKRGLAYSQDTGTGVVFYALGALPEFGKVGVIALERTRDAAQDLYGRAVAALDTPR